MTTIYEAALHAHVGVTLPTAGWDVTSFLQNGKSQVETWGGLFLMLIGVAGLIWGGVSGVRKLMANQQTSAQQAGWAKIAGLVLVGGALATGGFQLVSTVGSGGQQTIEDLGGGTVIAAPVDGR
ncbi:hypothetical protein [Amycolatopsis sp. CA-230715]|uniref:hypothetical protein n=1 Tax=Amycolatopsis sp. CA-230715 TaxID=2745196 RepID=UPI001C00E1B2|nr:hypothetical protein [Amycolatopsis sp. CA-230715]QWF85656.1 hypothetical protein HUW46_09111 [Amycolatopsis sp. CA-230715]